MRFQRLVFGEYTDIFLGVDIVFEPGLDGMNFQEIPAGTPFGRLNGTGIAVLEVWNERERDVVAFIYTLSQQAHSSVMWRGRPEGQEGSGRGQIEAE